MQDSGRMSDHQKGLQYTVGGEECTQDWRQDGCILEGDCRLESSPLNTFISRIKII